MSNETYSLKPNPNNDVGLHRYMARDGLIQWCIPHKVEYYASNNLAPIY